MAYEMTIFRFIANLDLLLDFQSLTYLNVNRYSTLNQRYNSGTENIKAGQDLQ
jgi:hypothetical protein